MSGVRKFLFEQSFDHLSSVNPRETHSEREAAMAEMATPAPGPEMVEPEPEIPEPDPAIIEAVRAAALEEGRELGRQDALRSIAGQTASACNRLGDLLEQLDHSLAEQMQESRHAAMQTALAVVKRALPVWAKRHGADEVTALLERCLADLDEEPRVVLRVPDALVDELAREAESAAERGGWQGRLVVLGEAGLGPADCRIEWADGGIERDMSRLWHDIERCLATILQSAAPAEQDHPAI